MAAIAEVAGRFAFQEWRVGEQRGRDRLQRQRGAELLDHIPFAGKVQIDLHRAGAFHHVQAQRAHARHVLTHDAIALLGHPGNFLAFRARVESQAQESQAHRLGDGFHFGQMRVDFVAGLVQVCQQIAR